jgi:glycerol-3-phosphate cytidylyltransferase
LIPSRIAVDMSATLLHHGHIRLLKAASKLGTVVVLLSSDNEIKEHKGYLPELDFGARREILDSIEYVDEVIESPWVISNEFMRQHGLDVLVHGEDNANLVTEFSVVLYPRTLGVSSSDLRRRSAAIHAEMESGVASD